MGLTSLASIRRELLGDLRIPLQEKLPENVGNLESLAGGVCFDGSGHLGWNLGAKLVAEWVLLGFAHLVLFMGTFYSLEIHKAT